MSGVNKECTVHEVTIREVFGPDRVMIRTISCVKIKDAYYEIGSRIPEVHERADAHVEIIETRELRSEND